MFYFIQYYKNIDLTTFIGKQIGKILLTLSKYKFLVEQSDVDRMKTCKCINYSLEFWRLIF